MRPIGRRVVAAATCFALLLPSATQAHAQAAELRPTIAGLAISDCAALTADPASLAVLLRLELASSLATPIDLVAGTPSDARYQITIECGDRADELVLRLERTTPLGEYRTIVALHDESRAMRPRTLALAVAENLRFVEAPAPKATSGKPTDAPIPAAAAPSKTTSLLAPPPLAPRVLRYRDMSLGFGVPTATLIVIGSTLIAVGEQRTETSTRTQFASWGGTMLGFAVVGIIGTSISLGLFAKERRKAARATSTPTSTMPR